MAKRTRQRRKGTIPHRTYWTSETVARIDEYQAQHQIPSFSAAAETLVRIGLEQSPAEILAPIIVSNVRQAIHRDLERLITLQLYTAVEAGIGQRMAGAALRDIGRVKQDDPARYEQVREAAVADVRRRLARDNVGMIIAELYGEFADGDREGELRSGDKPNGAQGGDAGG